MKQIQLHLLLATRECWLWRCGQILAALYDPPPTAVSCSSSSPLCLPAPHSFLPSLPPNNSLHLWAQTGWLVAPNTRDWCVRGKKQVEHDAQAVLSPWNPKLFHFGNNCWLQRILWHMADTKSQLPILNRNKNQDKTLNS